MTTTPTPEPEPDDTVERLVKRSTKKSKVPERLDDLAASHVVAQALTSEPKKAKKSAKRKRAT